MEYRNTAAVNSAGDVARGRGGSNGTDAAAAAGKTGGMKSGGADARERHKLAERERRKSMRELFLSLHSLLPHADTVRKEQSTILDEIIKYIPMAVARRRSLETRRRLRLSALSNNKPASPSPSSPVAVVVVPNHSEGCNGDDGTDPPGGAAASPTSSKLKGTRSSVRSDGGGGLRESVDFDIRIAPEPTSWVSIRARGDRVNVSLVDEAKGGAASSQSTILLSAIFDEVQAHRLDLVRSTHYRDGTKLVHHSESKIRDDATQSPELFKARMQDLALKLHAMRRPPAQAALRKPRRRLTSQDGVRITSARRRRDLPPLPARGE